MRKIILILILLSCIGHVKAQKYTVVVEGKVGKPGGSQSCGNNRGLLKIKLHYNNGTSETIHDKDGIGFMNTDYAYEKEFDVSNKVIAIEFDSRIERKSGGTCGGTRVQKKIDIDTYCGGKMYFNTNTNDVIYHALIPGNAFIAIYPKIELSYKEGNDIVEEYKICKSSKVGIEATTGFGANTNYKWSFFDEVGTKEVRPPELAELIKKRNAALGNLNRCKQLNPKDWERRCFREKEKYDEADAAYNEYINDPTKPNWITVPFGWRPIPDSNIQGKASILLGLSNLYPKISDQNQAIDNRIRVRADPGCLNPRSLSNILTIVYMPDLPKMTMVTPKNPSCATTNDGEFTITFNRPLNSNERINLSLEKKNPLGEYDPHSVAGVNKTNMPGTTFVWGNIEKGEYRVTFTGGKIGPEDVTYCHDDNSEEFTITSPPEIKFDATPTHPKCYVDKGKIVINVTSGSANQYSLDGTNWTGFTESGVTIEDLPPATYTVWVSKNGNCAVSKTDITINKATQIQHEEGDIIHPGKPEAEDASIRVNRVWGGNPKTEGVTKYYDATLVTEKGKTIGPFKAYTNGFSIEELPAGTHKIIYTDANQCTKEIKLSTLIDPKPIELTFTEERNCSNDNLGEITVKITGGYPKSTDPDALDNYDIIWYEEGEIFPYSNEATIMGEYGVLYTVEVKDFRKGYAKKERIQITKYSNIDSIDDKNITVTHNIIYGGKKGTIHIREITGGEPPYRINWERVDGEPFSAIGDKIIDLSAGEYIATINDATNKCPITKKITVNEPDELLVSIKESTPIPCYNGEGILSAKVTGGSLKYTYQWYKNGKKVVGEESDSYSNIEKGKYSVRVEDGVTFAEAFIDFQEPDILLLSKVSKVDASCFGEKNGKITLYPQGGTRPYYFSIDDKVTYISEDDLTGFTITGLGAGDYKVWLKDYNGCEILTPKSIKLGSPDEIIITKETITHATTVNGTNGSIILEKIVGGVGVYTYSWSKEGDAKFTSTTRDIKNLSAGKYTVAIQDKNSCTVAKTFEVGEPLPIKVTIDEETQILCYGDVIEEVIAVVEGGYPIISTPSDFEYRWYEVNSSGDVAINTDFSLDRLQNLKAGTYKVIVNDSEGASAEKVVTFTQPDELKVELAKEPTPIICYGETTGTIDITVKGGPKDEEGIYLPYVYSWTKAEDPDFVSTSEDLHNLAAGTYTVIVTDANECQVTMEVNIKSPVEMTVDLGEDTTLCVDQSLVLNATITDPDATYLWTSVDGYKSTEPVIEIRDSSIYTVVVTNAKGCTVSDSIFVDYLPKNISASFIASTQVFAGEKFVIVDNSDPIPNYVEWKFPEEAVVTYEDDNYAEAIFETPGEYEITLQTYLGLCTAMTTKTIVVVEKEIENEGEGEENPDIQSFIEYMVYPNPTTDGRFKVEVELQKSQPINVKVFNMINNTLIDSKSGEGNDTYTFDYDMSILPSGIYFVLLETSSASQVRKLVIE
ncbi:hypothetical protein ATO12_25155 [Aquimarina atlantica]|uniref:Secretion system C-terminal sorting domain-containing protein n=1 Tax=Aquimarina atlantica TaxID=1317122 RepID=A0A023BQ79_9FLAO|nr:T9SS type A sorting domain-containing protein [Aquimarina atlantica]EZH72225.1 hypothetical protein ATO12_25155 [Aquimarina atlantica]